MSIQVLREKLLTMLPSLEGVGLVYVFGSQVRGTVGPMSDYDLGILVDFAADGRQIQARLAHELALLLKTDRTDVVLLNHAPLELAYAIVAQGTVLFERDAAIRVEYEAQVLSRYGDYLPVLRTQGDDILQGADYAYRIQRHRAAFRRTERTLGAITATNRSTQV